MQDILKILIVEDNSDDAELIVLELEAANYQVVYQQVETAEAMKTALDSQTWDVIFTDYSMPNFSAMAALDLVKERKLDNPFIVLSGSIGEETAVKLMRNGAHDYLLKNNLSKLVPVINRELREAKIRCERQQALEKVEFLAFYDELTKLPNRNGFLKALQQKIRRKHNFLVIFIDIDQYRHIKYGFGHLKSEQLIINVAKRLTSNLYPGDFLAKIGKDEFALIIDNFNNLDDALNITTEIHGIIDPPFDLEGFLIYASITIGVAYSNLDFQEAEEYLRAAEIANFNAKKIGIPSPTVIYNHQMQAKAIEKMELETELRVAINKKQLQLFYQPILELETLKTVGFEALIRWQHPQKGWISPAKFIPLAEQTGLIIPLSDLILETAYEQMIIWQDKLFHELPVSLSVNLSGTHLDEPGIVPAIINQYQKLNLKGVSLKIEITEGTLMKNIQQVINSLQRFQMAGIQISIDDFGTGYSSLSYLRDLPLNTLKIDRAFVSRIEDKKNFGIIQTIINLAKTLDLDVVAEGIETVTQMQILQNLGCQYGQGYLFSPAIPSDQIQDWLENFRQENSHNNLLNISKIKQLNHLVI
jgi:diguanylate cyclase (GGDEF)-like protein